MNFIKASFLFYMLLSHFSLVSQYDDSFIYNYKFDSAQYSQSIVSELFDVIYKNHVGKTVSSDSHDFGSIVLPASTEELTSGIKSKIEDVSISPDSKYFLVKILTKELWPKGINKPIGFKPWEALNLGTYFLFEFNTGEILEIFHNVLYVSFNSNNTLLISGPLTGSIYSLKSRETVFSKEGTAFFEFQDLKSDSLILFKETSSVDYYGQDGNDKNDHLRNNSAYLISLKTYNVIQSYPDLGNVNIFPEVSFDERFISFTICDRDISLSGGYVNLRDGELFCYDILHDKLIKKINHARFSRWAKHSNEFVFYDYKSDIVKKYNCLSNKVVNIFDIKDISWKDNYWEPDFDVEKVEFVCQDSILIISPIRLSGDYFADGYVCFINCSSESEIKRFEFERFETNFKNNDFFILGNRFYRYDDFSEVLRANSLHFDDSGKILIIQETIDNYTNKYSIIDLEKSKELGKGISARSCDNLIENKGRYLILGKSLIFDLQASKEIVNYDNDVTIDCVDQQKEIYITLNENKIEFYNFFDNEIIGTLFCNSDGWLFFDKYLRYDCSSEFSDQIYFSCGGEFKDKKMWVPNLWNKTLALRNNEFINAPKLLNCQLSSRNALVQCIDIPTVNYLIDEEKTVNLKNYSGKKVKISKSEILFQCDIWDEFNTRLLFSYFADYFGGFIAMTPDGYYSKSNDFYGKVALAINDTVFELSQIESNFYRPEIIYGLLTKNNTNKRFYNINRIKSPPKIEIEELKNDKNRGVIISTNNNQLTTIVQVTATDLGGGIKGIRLFNNGKIVDEKLFGEFEHQNEVNIIFNVDLIEGYNKIEAVGIAADNTVSRASSLIKYIDFGKDNLKPNLYVFGVGVDEYQNTKYNLNFCVKDMHSFLDTINIVSSQLYDSVFVSVIKNRDVTKRNIIESFEKIASQSKPIDVFVFYYAGHGIAHNYEGTNSFYFVTYDVTQMENISNCSLNGLSGEELKNLLKNIKAQKQISIIDACNSGAITNDKIRGGSGEENAIAKLNRSTGSAIIASTTSEQNASEINEIGHGVFTYALLKALAGGASDENCEITISGIENYLYREMPIITEKYRGEKQYPTFSKFGQNFPLGFKCAN